jgi:hypothetical protein
MWPLQKASVRVGTRRKRRLPGWLGVGWDNFFVVVNRKKSSSQNKKKSFQAKKLMWPLQKASVCVGTRRKSRLR